MRSASHRRRIAANITALASGDLLARAVSFVILTLVARLLGAEALGRLATGQLAAFIAPPIIDGGISVVLVRAIAGGLLSERDGLSRGVGLRALLASLWTAASCGVALVIGPRQEVAQIVIVFSVLAWSLALDPLLVFQARERLRPVVIVRATMVIAYGALAIVAVTSFKSIVLVAAALALTHLLGTIILIALLGSLGWAALAAVSLRSARALLVRAVPLSTAAVAATVLLNGGVLWLAIWRSEGEVGQYNAALRLIVVAIAPSTFFAQAALARFTIARGGDGRGYDSLIVGASRVVGALVVPAATLGVLFARDLAVTLYGAGFEASGSSLSALVVLLVPAYLGGILQPAYVAAGRDRALVAATIASAGVAVVLGIAGATNGPFLVALATVCAFAVQAIVLVVRLPSPTGNSVVRAFFARPLPAAASSAVVAGVALSFMPWWAAFVVGSLAYLGVAARIGAIRVGDLAFLRPE